MQISLHSSSFCARSGNQRENDQPSRKISFMARSTVVLARGLGLSLRLVACGGRSCATANFARSRPLSAATSTCMRAGRDETSRTLARSSLEIGLRFAASGSPQVLHFARRLRKAPSRATSSRVGRGSLSLRRDLELLSRRLELSSSASRRVGVSRKEFKLAAKFMQFLSFLVPPSL